MTLVDQFWKQYTFDYKEKVVVDDEYLKTVAEANKKKTKKKRKTKTKKTKSKSTVEEVEDGVFSINMIVPKANANNWGDLWGKINPIYILILMIVSFVLGFFVMRRRGVV